MPAEPVYDLPADLDLGTDAPLDALPEPEGDEYDDDEDLPCPPYVEALLGFDPDELFP